MGWTDRLLSFDTTRTAYKTTVQQFLYCCVCIRCRGNVFTEPLPRNDSGDTQTARWSHKPSFILQNKENRLKMNSWYAFRRFNSVLIECVCGNTCCFFQGIDRLPRVTHFLPCARPSEHATVFTFVHWSCREWELGSRRVMPLSCCFRPLEMSAP
jgi:hypothetical protein